MPIFTTSQDDAMVYITINVPYVRVSEMEFYVDQHQFTFYCKPYLLKLTFPHVVLDDDRTKAVYDINTVNTIHVAMMMPVLIWI